MMRGAKFDTNGIDRVTVDRGKVALKSKVLAERELALIWWILPAATGYGAAD
jgi:hypothetical protein